MRIPLLRPILCSALLVTLLSAPVRAADPATDAMQAAYAPYRTALFRTNSKAQPESEQAIAKARETWQSIVARFGANPPPPYDRDSGFAASLNRVASVLADAERQIREKQLAEAHETLEAARDVLSDLRRRNGITVYSDQMNAYHVEMEHLLTDGPKLVAGPQGPLRVMAHVGRLEYLAARLRSEASPALQAEKDFGPLLKAVEDSVAALRQATLSQDPGAIGAAIGRLKGPYSRMFLAFG